jgi:hypothetical protein
VPVGGGISALASDTFCCLYSRSGVSALRAKGFATSALTATTSWFGIGESVSY